MVCIFAIYCNLLSIYFDFQKKKKKILGNLATLVHFHFTKILCMSCNGIYFFFVFGVTKQQKFTQKMQLKPNSMCCCYVANNSHQLDQISHACNFITPCVMEISFLPTYDSHDRGSHAHKVKYIYIYIYIFIYILTHIICSSFKSKHTCSSYVFSNLW